MHFRSRGITARAVSGLAVVSQLFYGFRGTPAVYSRTVFSPRYFPAPPPVQNSSVSAVDACDAVGAVLCVCAWERTMMMMMMMMLMQVKARNASAEVIYRTRHVNMSRAAANACDIVPSALPSGKHESAPFSLLPLDCVGRG